MAKTQLTNATAKTPRKKGQLPTKVCATCGRPFEWRKKWAAIWKSVRYCSERCRNQRADNRSRDSGSSLQ